MAEANSFVTNLVRPQTSQENFTTNDNTHTSNISVAVTTSASDSEFTSANNTCLTDNFGDSCSKRESLQQLTTNALPPYVPNPLPNIPKADFSNYEYHCCTDCGDTFTLRTSLKFHLERRSILIKFTCDACKSIKIFYNRCILLSHIRAHNDKGEKANISKAVVTPLPRIFMDELHSDLANSLEEDMSSADRMPATDLLEFSLKEVENEKSKQEKDEPHNRSNRSSSVKKVKCLDCNEEFNSLEERAQHLTQNDKIQNLSNQCNKCNMICPSKCFLKAHQRIHLQISPYICPECGESPSPMWQTFQYHVKFKCYHNARNVGYKCQLCQCISANQDALLKHMEEHTDKLIKCNFCIRAFTNMASFNIHVKKDHPNVEKSKSGCTVIFKCIICDVVFLTKEQIQLHKKHHVKDQLCEYVYNCMQCSKLFENKRQLNSHLKADHPKLYKTVLDNFEPKASQSDVHVVTYGGKVECILCNNTFVNYQAYQSHLNKAHVNYNQPCTYCYMILVNRIRMVEHGKKHLNKGSFLCLLCNNRRWCDAKKLDRHLINHTSKLQHCTFCPVCDIILKTPNDAINHLREEHMLFEEMGKEAKLSPKEMFTCHFCRLSFENECELEDHLEISHKTNEVNSSDANPTGDNEEEPVSKQPRLDGNVCAKCNYYSAEREDFKKHIISHKTHKTSLQCQECGECYIVEPSLVKHLRIVHKITDTKKYIEQEGTNYLPDVESNTEVSTCNSLLCNVCFTTFPNEASLKTHMRSHGMAFIHKLAESTAFV